MASPAIPIANKKTLLLDLLTSINYNLLSWIKYQKKTRAKLPNQ